MQTGYGDTLLQDFDLAALRTIRREGEKRREWLFWESDNEGKHGEAADARALRADADKFNALVAAIDGLLQTEEQWGED